MFIKNIDELGIDTYVCNKIVAKYLMNKKIPLLSFNTDTHKFIFKDSIILRLELQDAPIWIRILT